MAQGRNQTLSRAATPGTATARFILTLLVTARIVTLNVARDYNGRGRGDDLFPRCPDKILTHRCTKADAMIPEPVQKVRVLSKTPMAQDVGTDHSTSTSLGKPRLHARE
jgi:hypothetical protein